MHRAVSARTSAYQTKASHALSHRPKGSFRLLDKKALDRACSPSIHRRVKSYSLLRSPRSRWAHS